MTELATEELALYDSLLDAKPRRVTAFAVGRDEAAQVCAASFTVEYESGPPLHSMVSLAEASAAHQFVAVASERTVVFDQMDEQVPLSITGVDAAGQDVSLGENHGSNSGDIFAHELGRYLTAVDESDISFGNAARWTRVASTWWAARQSMSVGGEAQVPALEQTKRPPSLTVIEGGGHSSSPAVGRPALIVVA